MKTWEELLTKERLTFVREHRKAQQEEAFRQAEKQIGAEALVQLRRLYSIFDEKIYIWLAGLWDRDAGAFYYSESARDTRLYGPDIESTVQVLRFLNTSGMLSPAPEHPVLRIPASIRDKMVAFAHSLQDPDGYFYHPQWGKNISVSRRGRDLCWASELITESGESLRYLLPTQKTAAGNKSASLPGYLQDIAAFRQYLNGMELSVNSYYTGNVIESTLSQISAAGEEFEACLVEWLNGQNRADNGLWEAQINYASVNGLMKIAGNYPMLRTALPHAGASLTSAIAAAMSDERMKFVCEVYNPWAAICSIFRANENTQDQEELASLRSYLIGQAPALISKTGEKIGVFRKEDGSYSYFKRMSSAVSQGAPAAVPYTDEGDVNATTICVGSTVRSMRTALRIPAIPVFAPEDGELFFELLECAPQIEKKYDIGDSFPEKPSYEEEIGE